MLLINLVVLEGIIASCWIAGLLPFVFSNNWCLSVLKCNNQINPEQMWLKIR